MSGRHAMDGTHRGKFAFTCPVCFSTPGKPCREIKGRDKGKTCKAHWERWKRYKIASDPNKYRVKAVWSSHYESQRSRH
jgi:hypothetical protein